MAVVKGTNGGFVTVAPTDDPAGTAGVNDQYALAQKDVSASDAVSVTSMGWWCDTASEESNFELGIYSHDATNNKPNVLLDGASQTNAKGTTAGWKVSSVNITITGSTTYWIADQLDNTTTTTNIDYSTSTGDIYKYQAIISLPKPWAADTGFSDRILAIYAVYTEAPPPVAVEHQFIMVS